MKIIYIGCVQSSMAFLKTILSIETSEVVGIVTKRISKFNNDFVSLENIAKENDIPCFIYENSNFKEMSVWVEKFHADIIYCFGWSYLLPEELISTVRLGAIGYHPALLPANRGRHPIIWALALGLKETGSSFFFLDKEADSGDLLSQEKIQIDITDNAATLYDKLLQVGVKQIKGFTKQLSNGTYKRISQDNTKANIWRRRNYKDGIIDWRMSAMGIYNLVRALTHPYVGAEFVYQESSVKVWRAEIVEEYSSICNNEPGKVLSVCSEGIVVQCGQGSILLCDIFLDEITEGDYLL